MNREQKIGLQYVDFVHTGIDIDGRIVLPQENDLRTQRLQLRCKCQNDCQIAVLFVIAVVRTGRQGAAFCPAVTGIEDNRFAHERSFRGQIDLHRLAQCNDDLPVFIEHTEAVEAVAFVQGKGINGIGRFLLPAVDKGYGGENRVVGKVSRVGCGMSAVERHTEGFILLDAVDRNICRGRNHKTRLAVPPLGGQSPEFGEAGYIVGHSDPVSVEICGIAGKEDLCITVRDLICRYRHPGGGRDIVVVIPACRGDFQLCAVFRDRDGNHRTVAHGIHITAVERQFRLTCQ